MSTAGWIIVGFLALSALVTVWMVGKPREPVTPGGALATVVIYGALVIAALHAHL